MVRRLEVQIDIDRRLRKDWGIEFLRLEGMAKGTLLAAILSHPFAFTNSHLYILLAVEGRVHIENDQIAL